MPTLSRTAPASDLNMTSLKNKIILSMLVALLAGMWSLSWYLSSVLKSETVQLLGAQQLNTTTVLADEIDHQLAGRLNDLETMARTITPGTLRNTAAAQKALDAHPVLLSRFNGGVFTTDLNGVATASLPLALGRNGVSYLDRDYVKRALLEGQPNVGEPMVGRMLRTPTIGMAVPIRNPQGAVIGVLAGIIDLSVPSFLNRIGQSKFGSTGGFLLISPQSRRVITATYKNRVLEQLPDAGVNPSIDRYLDGYQGWSVIVSAQGIEMLAAAKRLPTTGWIAASSLPTQEAFAAVRIMQWHLLLGSTLLSLGVGGMVWWILRRHLSPLGSAVQAIHNMARNRQPLQRLPVERQDEVGKLIHGFNHLIEAVEARETTLTENDQTLRNILETTLDGFWRTSVTGALLDVNAVYCQQSGYSRAELLQLSVKDLDIHENTGVDLARIQRLMTEGHDQFESLHRRKDGSVWHVEISTIFHPHQEGEFIAFLRDISGRKQTAKALEDKEQRLSAILEGMADTIIITDPQGNFLSVNQTAVTLLGYTREEFAGKKFGDLVRPVELSRAESQFAHLLATRHLRTEFSLVHKSGESIPVELNATVLPDGSVLGACRDITKRRQNEERLQLAASVFTHAREGIMITAPNGTILDVNDTFTHITGYSRDEVLGQNPRILNSGRQDKAFYAALWSTIKSKGQWSGEVWNRRKNGELFMELQSITSVKDTQGTTQNYVALFTDITIARENQHKLEHLARFDALTSLPNRVLLGDRLHQAMALAQRRGKSLAVAYLDVDNFKAINDRHDHDTGDQLLMAVADKLKHVLRDGDTLARLGGDEFAVVLVDMDDIGSTGPLLERLLAAAAQPLQVGAELLQVSISLGVTFYPQADEVDGEQLLRQADQAMYQAKQSGKGRYHVFDQEQDRALRGHHEGLDHIRQALAHNEFVLFYQPKVNMRKGEVIGAEALIRWQHPTQGLLPPGAFLPIIENDPLSIALGEWVIETALTQIETWRAAGVAIPISVNVGASQLQQPQFFQRLRDMLARHPKVKPGNLELELLETSALGDLASMSKLIEDCRDIGVAFALDDFGTGYSSLTYLKRLPVALLKIDQGFVRDMLDDPDDLAILEGVIGLSQAFRRDVIAEGVETVEHGEMLLRMGCDKAQGYGIARPMPAHALPAWKETWQADPSWSRAPRSEPADLPLLVALVELRAWARAMENYLAGERDHPPHLDHHTGPFGQWLNGHGLTHYGQQADYQALVPLHHRLHAAATQLYALKTQNLGEQTTDGMEELNRTVAALLQHLRALIQSTGTPNAAR